MRGSLDGGSHLHGSNGHGSNGHRMCDDRRGRICAALDAHLNISPLELKLGDIFFYQEINKLFQLFLIHECIRLSSAPHSPSARMPGFRTELKRDQVLGGRRQYFVSGLSDQRSEEHTSELQSR